MLSGRAGAAGLNGVIKKTIHSLLLTFLLSAPAHADGNWTGQNRALYNKAVQDAKFTAPADMQPTAVPMKNGKSFFLVWTSGNHPAKWIVSLPGTHGLATDEFALWARSLEGRSIGLIEVQWWLGTGDDKQDYLNPEEMYRELHMLLQKLGVEPGHALLHGFSRGSANIYALAALDRNKGDKFFNTIVANSGGAAMDYPPTREVDDGLFGDTPFEGTQWVTVCGAKDPYPTRDGCPAMRRTADWLKAHGAAIGLVIEDPNGGHGVLPANAANTEKLLDWFLRD